MTAENYRKIEEKCKKHWQLEGTAPIFLIQKLRSEGYESHIG